jgi:hypothetical protein
VKTLIIFTRYRQYPDYHYQVKFFRIIANRCAFTESTFNRTEEDFIKFPGTLDLIKLCFNMYSDLESSRSSGYEYGKRDYGICLSLIYIFYVSIMIEMMKY